MSAIAGIVALHEAEICIDDTMALMHALQRFPADDVRVWQTSGLFLACLAQWITPESITERLPRSTGESGLAITADAILDNRTELFDRLGIPARMRSGMPDSELILQAYRKWGEAAPAYLAGDFAFMIWDDRNKRLFGARDFSGSRTLYYRAERTRFAFCTAIKPLLSLTGVKRALNESWLAEYLAISGMVDAVDTGSTVYQGIGQLPPAHSITVTAGGIALKRYCSITPGEPLRLRSSEDYVEAFQAVYQEAVSARVRTHRGVAAQLSGGLDSGSVVSFAAQALRAENKRLHTFSYVPPSDFVDYTPDYLIADERPYMRETVQHVGGIDDHYFDFAGRNSYSEIDPFLDVMEMPYKFFENSFWLKGMFEKAQELGVGVLLNGGRGNLSISWGSAVDFYALLMKRLRWLRLYREVKQYCANVGVPRSRFLPYVGREAFPTLGRALAKPNAYMYPTLINRSFALQNKVHERLWQHGIDEAGWFATADRFEQRKRHFAELFHWNASNTLAAKLSLQHAVWKRDPTNDLRVIRFCLSVPEEQYVRDGLDRALIRRATKRLLPDKVRLNQRIQGVQGADWVHRMMPDWPAFLSEAEQLSQDREALHYMNGAAIRQAIEKAKGQVRPEFATDPDGKVLMRSVIVYRFLKNMA